MRGFRTIIFHFLHGYEVYWNMRDAERLTHIFSDTAVIGKGSECITGREAIDSHIYAACMFPLFADLFHISEKGFSVETLMENEQCIKMRVTASVVFLSPQMFWRQARVEFLLRVRDGAIRIIRERELNEEISGCEVPAVRHTQLHTA